MIKEVEADEGVGPETPLSVGVFDLGNYDMSIASTTHCYQYVSTARHIEHANTTRVHDG